MQALSQSKPWESDPYVSTIQWQQQDCSLPPGKKLRVGFVIDDGRVKPQPPITRAVERVVAVLKAAGHEGTKETAVLAVQVLNMQC